MDEAKHVPMEELDLFNIYENVADEVWKLASSFAPFAQRTLGEQLVRAIDSINANLVEGDGRYTIPDSIRFFIIGRASAREGRLWLKRAVRRRLIDDSKGTQLVEELNRATKLLNLLINYRRKSAGNFVREELSFGYQVDALAAE